MTDREAIDLISYVLSIPGVLTATMLELDPVWAPLREFPEFRKLLREHAVR